MTKRRLLVYRAEPGAGGAFGKSDPEHPGLSAGECVTKPEERKPIATYTIAESEVDKARSVAREFVKKKFGEEPASVHVLEDGSISVLLAASRS